MIGLFCSIKGDEINHGVFSIRSDFEVWKCSLITFAVLENKKK